MITNDDIYNQVETLYKYATGETRKAYSKVLDIICEETYIKNKAIKIITEYHPYYLDSSYYMQDNKYISFSGGIKALSVYLGLDFQNDNYLIEAEIGWGYSSDTRVTKKFPYSLIGFQSACAWIDEQRIQFAQQLL